jgi:hypothetical protein
VARDCQAADAGGGKESRGDTITEPSNEPAGDLLAFVFVKVVSAQVRIGTVGLEQVVHADQNRMGDCD